MYPESFISALVDFCERKDIYLIMDDIYHRLVFDGRKPPTAYDYTDKDIENTRIIAINGVSKLYGLTGLRIGWAVANRRIIEVMTNVQSQVTSCPSVVSQAAAEGAQSAGGFTVGILPGIDRVESPPNPFIDLAIFTGMGQARNQILVLSADAIIGVGGGWGTLSEIGLALKYDRPVILLDSWELEPPDGVLESGLHRADSATAAVDKALIESQPGSPS